MKINKVFITGFSGSGKTHLLSLIKKQEKIIKLLDLDQELEKKYLKTIDELVSEGWEKFREKEHALFLEIFQNQEKMILSLGGGSLLSQSRNDLKKPENFFVWLNVSFSQCWLRIQDDSKRPLVKEGESKLQKIYQERLTHYQSWADYSVDNPSLAQIEELSLYILKLLR
jgi:shikimate kinase